MFVAEGDLWAVAASGGSARRLTTHPAQEGQPALSPGGSEVAFVNDNHWTHDGKTTVGTSIEIYRFEPDGSLVIRTWWEVPQDREIMREYVS